jgi:phytoene dehydrogenase-like protein
LIVSSEFSQSALDEAHGMPSMQAPAICPRFAAIAGATAVTRGLGSKRDRAQRFRGSCVYSQALRVSSLASGAPLELDRNVANIDGHGPCVVTGMANDHVIIVGGGLAGLSAGCYARASGFRTTIIEHNLALGGVCQAWSRGPYTIDGCIHWLTGGSFDTLYRELGIFPKVSTHTIENFAHYHDVQSGVSVDVTRNLEAFRRALIALAPEDAAEIRRLLEGAESFARLDPGITHPPELATFRESLRRIWDVRGELGTLAHFRKDLTTYMRDHLKSPALHRLFTRLLPGEAPTLFLLMMLGYLGRGWLSRPDGGTARFRDALIDRYHALGGAEHLHATVDEVLVTGNRARGVRLADGSMLDADFVISTSSAPETVLRLLGGAYGEDEVQKRLETWKLFDPIALVSYGVSNPLSHVAPTQIIDGIAPIDVGGRSADYLYLRIFNDDPTLAPPGHTVVQATIATSYQFWAKTGTSYAKEKDLLAERVLRSLEQHLPAMKGAVTVVDVATPLTFWNMARSWRGAFEGWIPTADALFGHVSKTLPGLDRFYMAGQWVEPGGGVPMAIMSGRQVVQLLCANQSRSFGVPKA